MPKPRKLLIDDRLALSKEALKTKSSPAACARSRHSRAIIKVCSGLSMTQGPAITVSRPSPKVALPTEKDLVISRVATKRHKELFIRLNALLHFVLFCGEYEYTLDLVQK